VAGGRIAVTLAGLFPAVSISAETAQNSLVYLTSFERGSAVLSSRAVWNVLKSGFSVKK
jgi:hypothetical protein